MLHRDRESDRRVLRILRALVAGVPDNLQVPHEWSPTLWPALIKHASEQGLLGILLPYLPALDPPTGIRQQLDQHALIQQLWDRHVVESLESAVGVLDQSGIRSCALKGPALAARLYRDRAARQSMDVDLLVRPEDLAAARRALDNAGYTGDADIRTAYLLRHSHHLHFSKPGSADLELHFHAYAGFGAVLPASALMDRAIEYRLKEIALLVPAPEEEFVYLATHAAGHSFVRMVWLFDLKLLLHSQAEIDWSRIANLAHASGVAHAVAYTIRLLETWLGVEIGHLPASLRRHSVRSRIADSLLWEVSVPQPRSARDNLGGLVFTSLLCDTAGGGVWLLQHHIRRMIRRRLHQRAPRYLPDRWSA